ncbi:hypothetical protein R5R35_012399 [Gryllus longicercus]|uniref:AB hydrolase-1 domain-containing protein n=1 Tax=Gryllus longicercus TaxID=2509291 RepID=A0AAN9VMF9_9ORTH
MTEWTEVRVPVPWGHVAAKSKGNPKDWPVLCVHGIQDNANTFDHLVPLLPSSFFYVCVDLPGHGFSSPFPSGLVLDFFDYVLVLKRVVDYFEWKKVVYMAHSLGAQLGTYFSVIFPEIVAKLIMLDAVGPFCIPTEQFWEKHRTLNKGLCDLEQRMQERAAPKYSYNEAVTRLTQNRFSNISYESAETLVKRSLIRNDEGYSYSTDQRLKLTLWANVDAKTQISTLAKIQCPQLLIIASESAPFFKMPFFKNIISVYKRKYNFTSHVVKGNHDVHLDHPERVANLISKFLKFSKSSL